MASLEEHKYDDSPEHSPVPSPRTIAREQMRSKTEQEEYLNTTEQYVKEMQRMEHEYDTSESDEWSDEEEIRTEERRRSPSPPLYYYQCICLTLMLVSAAMIIAMVLHFQELTQHAADRSAYFRYLHTALDIRHRSIGRGRNISVLQCCYDAIHDREVVVLYQSANIHLSGLDVNLEEMSRVRDRFEYQDSRGMSRDVANKKHQLIALCDTELQLMIHKLKRQRSERKRIAEFHRLYRAEEEAKTNLMKNAYRIHQALCNGTEANSRLYLQRALNITVTIDACDLALQNETVLLLFKSAKFDESEMRNRSKKVLPHDMYKHEIDDKQELVLGCALQLIMHELAHNSNRTKNTTNADLTVNQELTQEFGVGEATQFAT